MISKYFNQGIIFVLSFIILGCSSSKKSSLNTIPLPALSIHAKKKAGEVPYQPTPTRYMDLVHTKLAVELDWKNQFVLGKATLTLKPYFYPTDSVVLDAKGFDIHEVSLIKNGTKTPLTYQYDSSRLSIQLGKTYKTTDTFTLYIDYISKPNLLAKGGSEAITEDKGFYFINPLNKEKEKPREFWTQGETQSNSCWFPTIDNPAEKHTQEIYVTVENKFVSLSNGKLISITKHADGSHTDYWRQDIPHSVYLTMICGGEFEIIKDTWRGKEVSYYMEPKYKDDARRIFGRTPEMLEFFSKKLGVDFPWDKYSQVIVREYVSGAMENTSAVTFNSDYFQKDARELVDENDDETVAHELFHHWFGDLVTCESWSHLTLNESFANYSEYLWDEYKLGKAEADFHAYGDIAPYYKNAEQYRAPLVRLYYSNREDMFDIISYNKGGRIVHLLRNTIGDDAFFLGLKKYLTDNAYKTAEVDNLRMAFEEVSGQDLRWFFDQWYFRGGHPILDITYKKLPNSCSVVLSQKASLDSTFAYKLPLKIDVLYADGSKETHAVNFYKHQDTFTFSTKSTPVCINVDADKTLICQKTDHHTTTEWLYLLEQGSNFNDQYEALEALRGKLSSDSLTRVACIQELYKNHHSKILTNLIKYLPKDTDSSLLKAALEKATTNTSSWVRAAAVDKLGKMEASNSESTFVALLADSSYKVEASALKALNKIDHTKAIEEANKRKDLEKYEILDAVADVFSTQTDTSYVSYYTGAIEKLSSWKKMIVLNHFTRYFVQLDAKNYTAGLAELKKQRNDAKDSYEKYMITAALTNAIEVLKTTSVLDKETANKRTLELKSLVNAYNEKE